MKKMIRKKNILYGSNFHGNEPEFFMKVGKDCIDDCLLSVAHRRLSNRETGVIRHTGNPMGRRTVNGVRLEGAFKENKKDARIYHDGIEEHINVLGLKELGKNYFLISNGNLGNNFWHISWQYNEIRNPYCLKDEPFLDRAYSCFVVPIESDNELTIERVRFNASEQLLDKNGDDISKRVKWCNYGQQIVRDSGVVSIDEIVEEFYDVKHVLNLKDYGETKDKDIKKMQKLYESYPIGFKDNLIRELETKADRADYYHSVLGLTDDADLVIYHYQDQLEEIAKRAIDKGIKNAIILDQGGSVGVYASWLYPAGGLAKYEFLF